MTDLERARWLLPDGTDEVEVRELAGVIAAARREGAEPVWAKIAVAALRKAAKPGADAQSIRAQLSLELERDDELPDWIWDLVDVVAQRGIERGADAAVVKLKAEAVAEAERRIRIEAHEEVQAARREIVALRRTIVLGPDLPALARDEALEEAAQVCELSAEIMQPDERRLGDAIAAVKSCAAAIRKLKEKA